MQVALVGQRMYTWMAFESLSGCPPKKIGVKSPLPTPHTLRDSDIKESCRDR